MRGEIERTAIRFDFYYSAGRDALNGAMDEDLADAFTRDLQNRARVKFARQLSRRSHPEVYGSCGKQGNWGASV
jgi:hypothetical protein